MNNLEYAVTQKIQEYKSETRIKKWLTSAMFEDTIRQMLGYYAKKPNVSFVNSYINVEEYYDPLAFGDAVLKYDSDKEEVLKLKGDLERIHDYPCIFNIFRPQIILVRYSETGWYILIYMPTNTYDENRENLTTYNSAIDLILKIKGEVKITNLELKQVILDLAEKPATEKPATDNTDDDYDDDDDDEEY